MQGLEENSFDACVCDPPYGLEFMGKDWDKPSKLWDKRNDKGQENEGVATFLRASKNLSKYVAGQQYQEWCTEWAKELLRILKPGAYLLAFGGTRTYHRLVCGIEDAGFKIKDSLHWIHGSGFPKSYDISKGFDRIAGAEREIIGKNPNYRPISGKKGYLGESNFRQTDGMEWKTIPATPLAKQWQGWGTALKPAHEPIVLAQKPVEKNYCHNIEKWGCGGLNIDRCRIPTKEDLGRNNKSKATWGTYGNGPNKQSGKPLEEQGRFPPNLLLDEFAAEMLDEQSGILRSGARKGGEQFKLGRFSEQPGHWGLKTGGRCESSKGGASRFFPVFKYCAKASRAERTCNGQVENNHPTVKPIKLLQWLCRLVTPPDGKIIVPFAGSGSEMMAAMLEGFNVVGIEKYQEYYDIAVKRLKITEQEISGRLFFG